MKVAINGFGRIGRTFLRTIFLDKKAKDKLDVVAINLGPSKDIRLDLLFKYDSIMKEFPGDVQFKDNVFTVDGKKIQILTEPDPAKLPWKSLGIDWVIESSGHFTSHQKASAHITAGCKKVLVTAPVEDADVAIVVGVNDKAYDAKKHLIVSLGSCTTNAFAPIVKIINEKFGIVNGLMTTIHAYTNDQVLLDVEHKDPRRARAAAINIIPTKTGAAKVIYQIFPELTGKMEALAIRVPVPVVSIIDFAFLASKKITIQDINQAFEQHANGDMREVLQYVCDPLVSSDFIGNTHSCIFDSLLTQSVGNFGKVFAWYDNEFGYSCRLKDFLLHN
jgi:glyceraldehyde-3-phosphate dehydrogenase type I